jgi:hypothetical protein
MSSNHPLSLLVRNRRRSIADTPPTPPVTPWTAPSCVHWRDTLFGVMGLGGVPAGEGGVVHEWIGRVGGVGSSAGVSDKFTFSGGRLVSNSANNRVSHPWYDPTGSWTLYFACSVAAITSSTVPSNIASILGNGGSPLLSILGDSNSITFGLLPDTFTERMYRLRYVSGSNLLYLTTAGYPEQVRGGWEEPSGGSWSFAWILANSIGARYALHAIYSTDTTTNGVDIDVRSWVDTNYGLTL